MTKPYVTAYQTERIVVMDPQPEGFLGEDDGPYRPVDENFDDLTPPLAIGDLVDVREDWRVRITGDSYGVDVGIEFRDGVIINPFFDEVEPDPDPDGTEWERLFCMCGDGSDVSDWQPASTIPDWAVRSHKRVVGIYNVKMVDYPNTYTKTKWYWKYKLEDYNG